MLSTSESTKTGFSVEPYEPLTVHVDGNRSIFGHQCRFCGGITPVVRWTASEFG
jgi:hypothetical protein